MRLSAIHIRGFRSLYDAVVTDLNTVNALVGRNNSGKTALLESLLLLSTLRPNDVRLAPVDAVVPWDRTIQEVIADSISNLEERGSINLSLRFDISTSDLNNLESLFEGIASTLTERLSQTALVYELELKRGTANWPSVQLVPVSTELEVAGTSYPLLRLRPDTPPTNAVYDVPVAPPLLAAIEKGSPDIPQFRGHSGSSDTHMAQAVQGEGLAPFSLLLHWVTGLRFVSRTRQGQHTVPLNTSHLLSSDASNLPRYFQYLYNNHPQKWNELLRILRELVPWLHNIFAPIDEEATSARVAVREEQDAEEAFALANMGSGTVHLMTIVSMVWSTPDGGLCLIEEPEAGLHNTAQRDLLMWLRWHARERNKQLIFATHSTLFSNPADDISVYLATYNPETGTDFRRITPEDAPQVVQELGVRLTDLYAYDCILFLEGDSEMQALPPILDALGMDLELLGVRPIPLHGDVATRLQRMKEYLDYMEGSQVLAFVITDDDAGVRGAIEDLQASGHLKEDQVYIWHRKGAAGEFEDNFSDEQLLEAMNDLAEREGVRPTLSLSDLQDLRADKPRTKTSKLLGQLYHSQYGYTLPKPRLAQRLGEMAAQDIKQGKRDYQIVAALEQLRQAVTTKGQPA